MSYNKRVAIKEFRNENEQNVISYSQLRKLKTPLVRNLKQFTYFPRTLYIKSKNI